MIPEIFSIVCRQFHEIIYIITLKDVGYPPFCSSGYGSVRHIAFVFIISAVNSQVSF